MSRPMKVGDLVVRIKDAQTLDWVTACHQCAAKPEDPLTVLYIGGSGMRFAEVPYLWHKDNFFPAERLSTKDTNPKDAIGSRKVPMSTIPAPVLAEVAVGMLEGAVKYGRHNYRIAGVRSSVYYDACMRHLMQWWEGEDIDPDSGMSHITKAITSLVVLRDSMIQGNLNDDRPPVSPEGFIRDLEKSVQAILDRYPEHAEPYTQKDQGNAE